VRELLVRPLGIVTQPNPYGQYPLGACLEARNVVMRDPGVLSSAPLRQAAVNVGAASTDVLHQILPLLAGHHLEVVQGASWMLQIDSVNVTYPTNTNSPTPQYSATGRVQPFIARDRAFVNSTTNGIIVADTISPPSTPVPVRRAGLPQLHIEDITYLIANAVAIPANGCAGYAVLLKRAFADGYEVVSRPSPIVIFYNNLGGTRDVRITVNISPSTAIDIRVGDVVELYRTDVIYSATKATDPGTTLKQIASTVIDAAHIAAGVVVFDDATLPGILGTTSGKELYTNPGQQGQSGAHRQPDIAACAAMFSGYAFYGSITARPQWIFQVPAGIGDTRQPNWDTAAFRTRGIGVRHITGAVVTLGSPTVTGVSAGQMLGIVAGQRFVFGTGVGGANFPTNAEVISTTASSITFNQNATGAGTGLAIQDVVEVTAGGSTTPYIIDPHSDWGGSPASLAGSFGTFGRLEITTSENLVPQEDPALGIRTIRWVVEPLIPNTAQTFSVRATNGQNYSPSVPLYPSAAAQVIPYKTYKNLIKWSNDGQPEHAPSRNEAFIGNGEIIAMEATRDALWIFCTDGVYRLSGAGGQWRVDLVDTTLVASSPRATTVLREAVYAYTNVGLVRVTDAGVERLSSETVSALLPGSEYAETASIIVERNETDDEILVRLDDTRVILYSVRAAAYTTLGWEDITALAYARYPYFGAAAVYAGRSPGDAQPAFSSWNATSYDACTVRFQPMFAGDPFSQKQWVDSTWVFDAGSIGKSITPNWNGVDSPAVALKGGAQFYRESRAQIGVPRRVAVGHTVGPGFQVLPQASPTNFFALSLRYRQFGEQNLHR